MDNTLHPIEEHPTEKDPAGQGWSKDIVLIAPDNELRGYYDPQGSIAGGKYFYIENGAIHDCAILPNFPTHWRYA